MKIRLCLLSIALCVLYVFPAMAHEDHRIAITFILDGSGSMGPVQSDVVGGLNGYIANQKKENPNALFSLVVFDTEITKPILESPVTEINDLNSETTFLGGGTALFDAIGESVSSINESEECFNRLFVIYTDGLENSSKKWAREEIKKLIKSKERCNNWIFTYMGAHPDAYAEASQIGIRNGNIIMVNPNNVSDNFSVIAGGINNNINGSSFIGGDSVNNLYEAFKTNDANGVIVTQPNN